MVWIWDILYGYCMVSHINGLPIFHLVMVLKWSTWMTIIDFCKWLQGVKFLDSYASNLGRLVNPDEWKISGWKSHDCHVFLKKLLLVGIRGKLTSNVRVAITKLYMFFKDLFYRIVNWDVLQKMKEDIVIILSKFEHIFSPSFFNVMVCSNAFTSRGTIRWTGIVLLDVSSWEIFR